MRREKKFFLKYYTGILLFTAVIISISGLLFLNKHQPSMHNISSAEQLQKTFNALHNDGKNIEPYIINRLPKDFDKLPTDKRKKLFIEILLPIALSINKQIETEHTLLISINNKIKMHKTLSKPEYSFLEKEKRNYKTNDIYRLIKRVNTVPVSLMLAQAAVESGWGSSKFAICYNNIYGIHRKHQNAGKPIVMIYKNLKNAAYEYVMNLNTNMAYKDFRDARYKMGKKQDPYALASYLSMYSIRRSKYIIMIQNIMSANRMTAYDDFRLRGHKMSQE